MLATALRPPTLYTLAGAGTGVTPPPSVGTHGLLTVCSRCLWGADLVREGFLEGRPLGVREAGRPWRATEALQAEQSSPVLCALYTAGTMCKVPHLNLTGNFVVWTWASFFVDKTKSERLKS